MDDQRDLPEGVRITGATEAGPAAGQPGAAKSAPRPAVWGAGDEEEVWDDAWLAADGDLDGHAPAPAGGSVGRGGHEDDTRGGDAGLWGETAATASVSGPEGDRLISINDDDADDDGRSSWRTYTRSTARSDDDADDEPGEDLQDGFGGPDDEFDDESAFRAAGLRSSLSRAERPVVHDDDDDEVDDSFGPSGEDIDLDDDIPGPRGRSVASFDDAGDDDRPRRGSNRRGAAPSRGARPSRGSSSVSGARQDGRRGVSEAGASASRRPGERPAAPRAPRPAAPVVASTPGRRVATGLALAFIAAVVLKALDKPGAILLLTAAGAVGAYEFVTSMRQRGFGPAIIPVVVSVALAPIAGYRAGGQGLVVLSILTVLVTMLWYLVGPVRDRPTANIAVSLLAFAYLGWAVSLAAVIVAGNPLARGSHGIAVLVGVIVGCAAHDIVALFVGKNFGRLPIAPEVSPNKTLEGLLGGVVGAVIAGGLYAHFVQPFKGDTAALVFFVLVLAVLAPLGDLVESMLKRDLDRKDMGTILPGHGGVLDRIDAMVFVLPAVYLLAVFKHWV